MVAGFDFHGMSPPAGAWFVLRLSPAIGPSLEKQEGASRRSPLLLWGSYSRFDLLRLLSLEGGVLLLDLGEKVRLGQKVQGHAGLHLAGQIHRTIKPLGQ